jgi:hypothetical protein
MGKLGRSVEKAANKLAFWQSKAFFTLTHEKNGRVHEDLAGQRKPRGVEFVKGGRNKAYEAAARIWHYAQDDSDESAKGESDKPGILTPGLPGEKSEAEGRVQALTVGAPESRQVTRGLQRQRSLKPLSPPPVRITPRMPPLGGGT